MKEKKESFEDVGSILEEILKKEGISLNKEILKKIIKKTKIDMDKKTIEIDYFNFDKLEIKHLINYPTIILKVYKYLFFDNPSLSSIHDLYYSFKNFPPEKLSKILHDGEIGNLYCFDCLVTSMTKIHKNTKIYTYRCVICGELACKILKEDMKEDFYQSKLCQSCNKQGVKFTPNKSETIPYSLLTLQEHDQENFKNMHVRIINGKVNGEISKRFMNNISLGDKIKVYGVFDIQEFKKPFVKNEEIDYIPFLNIISYEKKMESFDDINLTEKDIERIKEMSKDQNLKQNLIDSFAPNIYGYEEIKYALLLQMVGGSGDKNIHILLIGDPGTAKSSLLEQVSLLAPKCIYTSGKSASGSGLSVVTEKSKFHNKEWVYKAGALVLANKGMLIIDEFNHLTEENKSVLNQAMEHKVISVSKAGGVSQFPADTCILAGANPKYERFDVTKPFTSQFDIPESLLSRFFLIFLFLDKVDNQRDRFVTSHILSEELLEQEYSYDELRKYISYTRKLKPKLTDKIKEMINTYFVNLREKTKNQTFPITMRYVKIFKELAIANAKLRLSDVVEEVDMQETIKLCEYMFSLIHKGLGTEELYTETLTMHDGEIRPRMEIDQLFQMLKEMNREIDVLTFDEIFSRAQQNFGDVNEIWLRGKLNYLIKTNKINMLTKNTFKIRL